MASDMNQDSGRWDCANSRCGRLGGRCPAAARPDVCNSAIEFASQCSRTAGEETPKMGGRRTFSIAAAAPSGCDRYHDRVIKALAHIFGEGMGPVASNAFG